MADTPRLTGRARRGKKLAYTSRLQRRRGKPDEDDSPTPQESENEKNAGGSRLLRSSVNLSRTSTPEASTSKSQTSSDMRFQVSVCTPLRTQGRRQSVIKSAYRTPLISSTVRKPYAVKEGKAIAKDLTAQWKEDVRKILRKTWKFCYLSSVFRFNIKRSRLKAAYERTLKARILCNYPSYHLEVKMSMSSFLGQNPKEVDAIFVHVTSLAPQEDDEEENKMVTVYHGILIRRQERSQSKDYVGADWYPLLLYSGLDALHNTFILWLQTSFDCYVTPRCLPTNTLLWVAGVWTYGKCTNKRHLTDRTISLQYQVKLPAHATFDPLRSKGKFTVRFECRLSLLMKVWANIKPNEYSELKVDDISKFHSAIDSIAQSLTHIPKSQLQLVQVTTPCISLSAPSKLRLLCETTFDSLLTHIIEVFQSTCHFKNINLNHNENEDEPEEDKSEVEEDG